MADDQAPHIATLREEFHCQTAQIHWRALQTYYAQGSVVWVQDDLNLVEVAVQLGQDNLQQFERWTVAQQVAPVSDAQALGWYQSDALLWAVVAPPWVLVQIPSASSAQIT